MQFFTNILSMKLNIKEIREQKKITQDEIVALCGIKKRTYVDYENGKSDIPLSKLQNIATALQVSIYELIKVDDENYLKEDPDDKYEIINKEVEAYKKTIHVLEREVDDLRDDKLFLKKIIENRFGDAKME